MLTAYAIVSWQKYAILIFATHNGLLAVRTHFAKVFARSELCVIIEGDVKALIIRRTGPRRRGWTPFRWPVQ